jgi:hypothetical protein
VNRFGEMLMRCNITGRGITVAALLALLASAPIKSQAVASDGPGDTAAWTTGKVAVRTSGGHD